MMRPSESSTPEVLEELPMAGIRVFELGTAVAGPLCTRYLAHFGAQVIKVESLAQPDILRRARPGPILSSHGVQVAADFSLLLNEFNSTKRSLALDLKAPAGRDVARRLLAACDVFVTNYSAPAIRALGLDYERVRVVRPDIIHAHLSGFGTSDDLPYYEFLAFGPNQAPLAGIDALTGWSDRAPSGIANFAYPDHSSAALGCLAILAALEYRDRTGEGQAIDLSQFEATVSLLGPLLGERGISDVARTRDGNRWPWGAPQGVYPCRGADRWVAITAVEHDAWRGLCEATSNGGWATDPRFASVEARIANHDELDRLISEWTSARYAADVELRLQEHGVAAGQVLDHPGLLADPQLAVRRSWQVVENSRCGREIATGVPVRIPDFPQPVVPGARSLGQDNDFVLGELCGLSPDEIASLVDSGVVFPCAEPAVSAPRAYAGWARALFPDLDWDSPATELA